ncbi:MAG: hypothetical protein RMK45_03995 [Armatimonadota bacterium]|nr:hypothetical protein [Armatimonadota bacterium]
MALSALPWAERLRPYRRRVRLLLVWRYGAIGGVAGALVATALSLLDWLALVVIYPWQLGACVVAGVLVGALYALLIRLPDAAIAQLIDRRAGLKDRLQTALEHSDGAHLFDAPLLEDAYLALQTTSPAQVLRLRFGRWQQAFVGALALLLFVQFLPQILAVVVPERREEQKEIKQVAKQIQEVAKPILEEAKKPDADQLTKQIAQQVQLYNKRAREAKMSKQEALLRYNAILEQARQLEQRTQRDLEQLNERTQTAAAQLEKLAQQPLPELDPQLAQRLEQLSHIEKSLQEELQRLQQQLQSGVDEQGNPLSREQRAALQQQIQQLQATLNALQAATLQHDIAKIQQQLQSGKDAQGKPLSPQQRAALEEQLKRLQQALQNMNPTDLQQQIEAIQRQLQSGKDLQGRPLSPQQRAALEEQLKRLQQALQNAKPADLKQQIDALQRQIQAIQEQLRSGKDAQGNPLSPEQREQLQRQLQSLQEQMRALKLSQEAREFLRKLQEAIRNDPAFKEAMEHLRKLSEQMQRMRQQQDPQQRKLTQEEIEKRLQELEKRIEELAKRYKSDEQIRELARQLLEQVKRMRQLCQRQGACLGMGMCNGFGLGMNGAAAGAAAAAVGAGFGQGPAWEHSDYFGQPELFNQGEKQPELKIPMKDTPVSGQPPIGPTTGDYIEFKAPPAPSGSSVPLSQALPSYQKKAEQALSQQNIPPAERKRVKRYFDSLRSGN